MTYSFETFVPFHFADPAGILYFGQAFTMAHQAFEHFITDSLDIPWEEWFKNKEFIVPIRHAEVDYTSPILAGKNVSIEISISQLGKTSFTSLYHFFQEKKLACTVALVHVFVNKENKKPCSISCELKLKLETGQTGLTGQQDR